MSIDWTTFVGGRNTGSYRSWGRDEGAACAVDGAGNTYVVGSTQGRFPVKDGPGEEESAPDAHENAFVAKFDASGRLLWSRCFGGTHTDRASGVAVDSSGGCYVVGDTYSLDFPDGKNPTPRPPGWRGFAFAMKFSPDGTMEWWKDLGPWDYAFEASADDKDRVYVLGRIDDSQCALAALNAQGDILWNFFFGGTAMDNPRALAAIAGGGVCIAGETKSDDFPTTGMPAGVKLAGAPEDGFLSMFDAEGGLLWSTPVGGDKEDSVLGLASDSRGNIYACGGTYSRDFPVKDGFDMTHNGGAGFAAQDAFVMKLDKQGHLLWSTYLGGSGFEFAASLTTRDNLVALSGDCVSKDFPVPKWDRGFWTNSDNSMIALFDAEGTFLGATVLGATEHPGQDELRFSSDGALFLAGTATSVDYPPYGAIVRKGDSGSPDAFLTKIRIAPVGESSIESPSPRAGE